MKTKKDIMVIIAEICVDIVEIMYLKIIIQYTLYIKLNTKDTQ